MYLQKELIKNCKNFINNDGLDELKEYYNYILELKIEYNINIEYMFKEVFYSACYKQNKEIILWLISIYNTFDDMTKIALRQIFIYGKYIFIKQNDMDSAKWFEDNTIF